MTSTILTKNLWNKKFFRIFSYGSATLILGLFGKVDLGIAQSQLQVKTTICLVFWFWQVCFF